MSFHEIARTLSSKFSVPGEKKMRFARLVLTVVVVATGVGIWHVIVSSQAPGATQGCKDQQRVQYRSSGSFVGSNTSQVKCTVDYWICNQPYSKSKIVKNVAGACDSFRDSVVNDLPKTACCDCYPNCSSSNGGSGMSGSADQSQKQDCCGEVQQLKNEIKELQDQVRDLQGKLNGSNLTLGSGGGKVSIGNDGVTISSTGNISIKATGTVSIKGAKVTTN